MTLMFYKGMILKGEIRIEFHLGFKRLCTLTASKKKKDQYQYLGYCPPTPPLTQQQSIDNKLGLMLGWGRDRWAVAQILILIQKKAIHSLKVTDLNN